MRVFVTFFHFSPKMRQPTDLCVRTLLCWTCNFYLCCNSLPLFHTSKASKRSMFTFQTLFCMDFEKLPALSNAKINAPNPKRFQEVFKIFGQSCKNVPKKLAQKNGPKITQNSPKMTKNWPNWPKNDPKLTKKPNNDPKWPKN